MEEKKQATILFIDDEEDIVRVMSKRLEKAGHRVITAYSGEEGLQLLKKETPDVIVLDIMMPGMDGFEVFDTIRQRSELAMLPVVFLTARDSMDDKIKGRKLGANDYITKPIDHRELLARIEAALKINDRYMELSLTDELTGLYNRTFFARQFSHAFDIAKRYQRIFSLLLIDIDDFKHLNDTHGHLCGDFVLKTVAERLRNSLRTVDIITRYGGDEFTVILPETSQQQADELVSRLRKKIGGIDTAYEGQTLSVTLSFGSATYTEEFGTKEDLFRQADRMMYQEKEEKK